MNGVIEESQIFCLDRNDLRSREAPGVNKGGVSISSPDDQSALRLTRLAHFKINNNTSGPSTRHSCLNHTPPKPPI